MVVQTNVLALNAHRNMKNVGATQKQASSRLSSGYRINNAADDAAGLAISEKMRSQIRGLDQASRNSQDGQALIMTAEGGLQEIQNMVQRIRELTVQAANDTNTSEDRGYIVGEIEQLHDEISSMAGRVEYNKKILLNGSIDSVTFQIGANATQLMGTELPDVLGDVHAILIGATAKFADTDVAATISAKLTGIDSVLGTISEARAKLGAVQNRLEFTYKSLDVSSENLSDSESRVRNTDVAKEMMKFTQSNVLQQAAVSMLAQANQLPQNLLQLLR